MKKIIVIVIILLDINSFGRSSYLNGDTLFVWSDIGLNLHETADPTSKIIAIIPFGDVIIFGSFESDTDRMVEFFSPKYIDERYSQTKCFLSKCKYIKVKYKDLYGYVAHSFVSKISTRWANIEFFLLFNFLEKEYGILKQTTGGYKTGENTFSDTNVIFNNGVLYSSNPVSENGVTFSYVLPDINFSEAILLVYMINKNIKKETSDSGYGVLESDEKSISFIRLECEVIYSDLNIKEVGSFTVITLTSYSP